MSYYEVYRRRLNRYGETRETRIQGEREASFEKLLENSVFRVSLFYNNEEYSAVLERNKQDETQTIQYLLTKIDLELPAGSFIKTINLKGEEKEWMIFWKENISSSGYNKYIVLKMSHTITWKDEKGEIFQTKAFFSNSNRKALIDRVQTSGGMSVFGENDNLNYFITSINAKIRRDMYFETSTFDAEGKEIKQGFKVTGYDVISTEGVEYVTVDPTYIYDKSPIPEEGSDGQDDDFWFNGGL